MNAQSSKTDRREFLRRSAIAAAGALFMPSIVPSRVLGNRAPSETLHIGQIGCGRIARIHDLPEILKHAAVRVTAACDADSKRLKEGGEFIESSYAKQAGRTDAVRVKTYADYREMLSDPDIDAVVISTPDHWHAQPAIEAVLAGKDVYLQKPASLTIQEGRRLADAVNRTGRVLQIGCQQRSMPQFRIACELVRNGRLGAMRTIQIGLPADPSGKTEPEMPVPPNLDYDRWLGSTPMAYYTENRVHPQTGYDRPGWLRCEQFGAGMITGWGSHHLDIAHWAMDTEHTGPVEVEAEAEFPASGLWDVHGKFRAEARYANGVIMRVGSEYPNGVRFEGGEGWIFVTRGDYTVTASDPASGGRNAEALSASDPKILKSEPGPDWIRLPVSAEHHADWIDAIRNRRPPIASAEVGHRSCSACLVIYIAMKLKRKLYWDPRNERFRNDDEANAMLSRPQRYPYGTEFVGRG
jgi:myo-inositol 2-dehydrogenase / D-chiro-inositol 1-dehydrogenase